MNWLLRTTNPVLEPVVQVKCLVLRVVHLNWLLPIAIQTGCMSGMPSN